MKITITPITSIKPNPNNPRLIKDDKFHKLVKSIKDFPQMLNLRPIVVNADMIVLGGNMRLKACKEAGLKDVPVIMAEDLTEEQQREFIIKDNVGFGEWDWEMIANEWESDKLSEWGLDIPHFEPSVDELEPQEEPKNNPMIKVSFVDAEEMQKAENDIKELIDRKYPNAMVSVLIK